MKKHTEIPNGILKPCPFCADSADLFWYAGTPGTPGTHDCVNIECRRCDASLGVIVTEDDHKDREAWVRESWNTRGGRVAK